MTLKNKLIPISLILAIMIFVSCQRNNLNNNPSQAKNTKINKREFSIDTFSTFPPEINGCSCYFSNDSIEFKKGGYIYIEDFEGTSFLKINGTLTKFILTDAKEIDSLTTLSKYKSKSLNMTLEIKDGKQSGDETSLKTGKITITDKKGKIITKTFYGECGC
ncbi:hypothetical protein [[Flexibacter] sp. ATCC 35103]|uniref:hypothetical protein n=1 Tax=[Flexibacter] sp. ATCC 35103 TaxID=1937528 RepID=UPI0009CC7602|nr:hypothetical protein [[Flexibacter] sp. ATCC 35103]OMQ08467.1 hypothetical protein BXU01_21155 [[Flexibacter] sp. ATCC 35103]